LRLPPGTDRDRTGPPRQGPDQRDARQHWWRRQRAEAARLVADDLRGAWEGRDRGGPGGRPDRDYRLRRGEARQDLGPSRRAGGTAAGGVRGADAQARVRLHLLSVLWT